MLDWPKMGAAIGKKAHEELCQERHQKKLETKQAKALHTKWAKQHAIKIKQSADKAELAQRHGSVKKWAVKLPHQPLKTKK